MDRVLALSAAGRIRCGEPARRISDLLSSRLGARAKSKRQAMDQPRTDEDQELVARTQSGDASAFDQLVIKYTPRLYGLVYNMTANHEDTNDLLQDIFSKAYKAIRGFRGKSTFYTWIHSIAVNMTLNFLKKRGRRFQLSLDDVDASIQNDKEIAKLLRLKRYEQPPPGYFENFLHEFHRRQRDELLRQPLWRICLDRAQDLMLRLNVRSLASYPAAAAAVLVCAAVISLKIYQQPETTQVALQSSPALSTSTHTEGEWTLASPVAGRIFRMQPLRRFDASTQTHQATTPRYVLDTVPVSYEPTFRF